MQFVSFMPQPPYPPKISTRCLWEWGFMGLNVSCGLQIGEDN